MNTAITDYEEFANSTEERDFYIAPAIMEGYKPRKLEDAQRAFSIIKSKLPNKTHVFQNLKLTALGLTGFCATYGVAGIVEIISKLI
jgi:hypothetical protein